MTQQMKHLRQNHWVGWVLSFLLLGWVYQPTTAYAQGQGLWATGEGEHWWIVRPEADNVSLSVLHRHASDEPGQLRVARKVTGRPARGGVANFNDRLWLVYDNKMVQSIRGIPGGAGTGRPTGMWEWVTRVEASLPIGVQIESLTADAQGPWALVRVEAPEVLTRVEALMRATSAAVQQQGETTTNSDSNDTSTGQSTTQSPPTDTNQGDTSSANAATPAGVAVIDASLMNVQQATMLPTQRLVRLVRSVWEMVELPAQWMSEQGKLAGSWVVMTGPGRNEPVLVQWWTLQPTGGNAPDHHLRWFTRQQAGNAGEGGGNSAAPAVAGATSWHMSEYTIRGESIGAMQALAVDGQLVAGQRINEPAGIAVRLHLLRPEGRVEMGVLRLSEADAGATWSLLPAGRTTALLAQRDAKNWHWSAMNLRGELTQSETVLSETAITPWEQYVNQMILVVVLVVATLMMFVFWRREPVDAQIKLPKEWTVAVFSTRAMAGLVDLGPCVGVSFAYFGVDWLTGLHYWPGRSGGLENILPGAAAIGLYVLHTTLTELFTGRTLGKMIFGLRVVNLRGSPPHLWQVLGRNGLKVLDLIAWPLLILPIISPQRQRLGDMVAKTLVVMPTPPEPPESPQPPDTHDDTDNQRRNDNE